MVMAYVKNTFGVKVCFFLLILLLGIPSSALAYIDPNTGNIIFQILFPIITAVVTGCLFCKNAIRRKLNSLKAFLGAKFYKNKPSDY
jgi:hypothetical protein